MSKSIGKMFDKLMATHVVLHHSKTCPECGTKLAARGEGVAWDCPNLDCPAQVRERIGLWCSAEAMDIPLADKALMAQLVNQGLVFDVSELYSLKLSEVAALEGRDKQFARDFLDQLTASKAREAWRALYGLSIPTVGVEAAKELCRHFAAVDDILPAGPDRIVKQAAVSDAIACSIAHWYGDGVNRRLVRRLQKAGVNFKIGF